MNISIESLETISRSANEFVQNIGSSTVFAFNGKMGAGKTTFIKAICEMLGVEGNVNSPTFSIVNEYIASENKVIYHFDFYRIENIQEAIDLGVEDYLYSGSLCFIEWAENIEPLLPDSLVIVEIIELENGKRQVIIDR
jgi:tRNA threonylcarbamoyladenosine biosynthesis protein TsaE